MSNKANKQTAVTVANAEQLLARFEKERADLMERKAALADKRRNAAYDAHAGDGSASKLLDGLHREAVELESRIAGLDDAIAEARRRLEQAREAAAREQDRERALLLRQALAAFIEAGKGCDAALDLLISASTDLRNGITVMNKLGCTHPSHAQLDALGSIALRTALTDTAWVRYFERVSPVERKTFAGLTATWAAMVERYIASRLGDDQTNKPEAA
jgi:hypothetical protein